MSARRSLKTEPWTREELVTIFTRVAENCACHAHGRANGRYRDCPELDCDGCPDCPTGKARRILFAWEQAIDPGERLSP